MQLTSSSSTNISYLVEKPKKAILGTIYDPNDNEVGKTTPFDPIAFFRKHTLDGGKKRGTHSTVGVYDDDTYKGWVTKGCQACLQQLARVGVYGDSSSKEKLKHIYSSLWIHEDQSLEDAKAYWSFVLDKEQSPWKMALKDSEIIYSDGTPIAYRLSDMDCPFPVIANLCFAIRMPYAQDGYLRMFTSLVSKGLTKTEALFITANAGLTPKGVIRFPYWGDYPFDTAWQDMSWSKFSEGRPTPAQKFINKGQEYSPCNAIWSVNGCLPGSNYDASNRKPTVVQKLLSGAFEYKGVFKKAFQEKISKVDSTLPVGSVDLDTAVRILRDNEKMWKVN